MLSVSNNKLTPQERRIIFSDAQPLKEAEIISADSVQMLHSPPTENQHLVDIAEAHINEDVSQEQGRYLADIARVQAAQDAQLAKLVPVDAACWGGRLMMLVSAIGYQPLEILFQSNLFCNSGDEGLNDAQRALLFADDFNRREKQQISAIFFWPIFKSDFTGRNNLTELARDFADNFRLKLLPATEVFLTQIEKLGPDNFLKLHNVMLNDQLANELELEKLRIDVARRIANGAAVSYSTPEVLKTLGKLVKRSDALPVFDPDCINSRLDWEKMTGFKVLLTFFANYLEIKQSDLLGEGVVGEEITGEGIVDDKIRHIMKSLSTALIKDAMSSEWPCDNRVEETGCLAPIYSSEIGSHDTSGYMNPLSLIGIFLQRAEEENGTMASYGAKLERLAALTNRNTTEIIATEINSAKHQSNDKLEKIKTVRDQLKSLTNRVGSQAAAYLFNIGPDKDTFNSVSFKSVKKYAGLAGRLAALFENDALADTSKFVSVLSELGKKPSIRFLNMFVMSVDGRPYQLPNDEGRSQSAIINNELVALFERLQSNFQNGPKGSSHAIRSMAQNVLSVLAEMYSDETRNAFFKYLQDQCWKPAEGIVQRYMANVPGCYLQRTMIESLVQERLNKVDENLAALWGLNHSTNGNYKKTYSQFYVSSRLTQARKLAEKKFKDALKDSIDYKIAASKNNPVSTEPDGDVLAFLNAIIKFQSDDTKKACIDLDTLSKLKRGMRKQSCFAATKEEEINWEKFRHFYDKCIGLARAIARARTNNNMPWGRRMALLGAEADLNTLNDMCDGLGEVVLGKMKPEKGASVRDYRITSIMNLLVQDCYNFKLSNHDEVRTSLRRIMMVVNEPGTDLENLSFESNALDYRLLLTAPELAKSQTYMGSPKTLSVHLEKLAEVQNYVFWQLPDLLNRPSSDSVRLYSDILVPLERITQGLLPLPQCPIIKQIHRETVGLLNFALKTHPKVLSPIAASILARSEVRDGAHGDVILSDIINNTDRLVEQFLQPAYLAYPKALTSAALTLLKDVLPLMYDERVESPIVQTALEMLNHERLADTLPSLVRQTENDVKVLADANAFKALVETFTNFKSPGFPDIDKMLKHYLTLKDLPEDAEPWVQRAALQKLDQARYLMQAPEDAEAGVIWSERIDELRKALTRVGLDALEIVTPDIRAAEGVNSRYLYLDEDISTLIQNAIERRNPAAETEEAEDQSQRRVRAQAVTLAPSAVGTVETLNDRVNEWLSEAIASEIPRVLILPYNPANTDGSNSLHWSAIILHLSAENALTVNYMNPLYSDSPIPPTLMRDMTKLVARIDQDRNTAVTKKMRFVSILHSSQDDATSCGPRIVADCTQIIEHWCNKGVLLTKLPAIEDVNALRQAHLEELGGLDSEFGQRQLWNLIYSDGTDLGVGHVRAQDRLKEALLDDLVTIHAADPNNFDLIKGSPSEKTWRPLTKNSTITRLINSDSLLPPDQLIKLSVEAAEKVFAMQSAFESLYETDLEIVGDFIVLQQLSGNSEYSHEQLAEHLRDIMTSYLEGAQNTQTRKLFNSRFDNADTLDRVIRGFYPTFKGINVHPQVSDLPGEIDALRKVLPSIDLAKSGYLKKALAAHVATEESDPVGTFELIQRLKQVLEPAADTSIDKKQEVSDTPDVSVCWQLMQRQIDMYGDSALLRALYPEALRAKYKTPQGIPKVYGDVLRKTLSKINLSSSARVGEITDALRKLRQIDNPLYWELFGGGEIEAVRDSLLDRYLGVRHALAEQETIAAGLQNLEGQGDQDGEASVARDNGLATAQKRRDTFAVRKANLLPVLEKVFVNFDDALSDDGVRALQSVPSDMLDMAVSGVRAVSLRNQPQNSAYSYRNIASRVKGFLWS